MKKTQVVTMGFSFHKFIFVFLLLEVGVLFSLFFLPTFASDTTTKEMQDLGSRLQTPRSIHKYVLEHNNYTIGYYPRDIDVYWETRIGDCTEIAHTEKIMMQGAGIDAKIRSGYIGDVKHNYITINGSVAFDQEVVPFFEYWYQKIMK